MCKKLFWPSLEKFFDNKAFLGNVKTLKTHVMKTNQIASNQNKFPKFKNFDFYKNNNKNNIKTC